MAVMSKSKLPEIYDDWSWDLSDENKIVAKFKDSTITITMPKVWNVDGYIWSTPNITWSMGGFETIESTVNFAANMVAAARLAKDLADRFCNK